MYKINRPIDFIQGEITVILPHLARDRIDVALRDMMRIDNQ